MRFTIRKTPLIAALGIAGLLQTAALAQGQRGAPPDRAAAEAACGGDAQRFCGESIPDEGKIATCLRANRAKISPACRAILN